MLVSFRGELGLATLGRHLSARSANSEVIQLGQNPVAMRSPKVPHSPISTTITLNLRGSRHCCHGGFGIDVVAKRSITCIKFQMFIIKFYVMQPARTRQSNYFLFMTSTYRDLAGFLAPRAPDAGRLDNKASSGSTFCGGAGTAVDDGLEGGNPGVDIAVVGVEVTGGAEAEGVGAGGCVMVVEAGATGVDEVPIDGPGDVALTGAFPAALFGGGGGGAALAGTSPA